MVGDLRRRYWSLVVTACEWRAYEVEGPEHMADTVFASLDPRKDADLRVLFRAVDTVAAAAYRNSVAGRSTLDAIRGLATVRPEISRPDALIALSDLRERDRRILQHAYWDDLDPAEIATVLRVDLDVAQRRLDDASRRYSARLVRRGAGADDVRAVLAQIQPGTHRRRP